MDKQQTIPSGDSAEQVWVSALQASQPEVLGLLYDKYAPVVLGIITRMVQNSATAEAVLEQTFATIWQQRQTYDASRLRLLSWIILTARDLAKETLLPTGAKVFPITAENSSFTPSDTSVNYTEAGERRVAEFCSGLNLFEKKALQLVYLQGLSSEEAAALLRVSEESLKAMLRRAVKQLGAERAA